MNYPLLIKPAGADCNLRCDYCFYLSKGSLLGGGPHRMSAETLETLMRRYFAEPMTEYSFAWQGGEPLLMGLDFYRRAVELETLLCPRGARVTNIVQTNGTLLNDEWAGFLAGNGFLVGISLDGPLKVHNRHRSSHRQVVEGLRALRQAGAAVNSLTLVSDVNAGRAREVYGYLCGLGFEYQQYIECVEFTGGGVPRPYSLKPGEWGRFLCELFDVWYAEGSGRVSIRLFDAIVSRLKTGIPTMCSLCGDCRQYLVVEHTGDVFPCDFHVDLRWHLGNVRDTSLSEMTSSELYRQFGEGKRRMGSRCGGCRYRPLCQGDCQKNRRHGQSYLCDDWRMFYDHTIERFEALAADIA